MTTQKASDELNGTSQLHASWSALAQKRYRRVGEASATIVLLYRGKRTCRGQVPEPVKTVLALPVFKIENLPALLASEEFHANECSKESVRIVAEAFDWKIRA